MNERNNVQNDNHNNQMDHPNNIVNHKIQSESWYLNPSLNQKNKGNNQSVDQPNISNSFNYNNVMSPDHKGSKRFSLGFMSNSTNKMWWHEFYVNDNAKNKSKFKHKNNFISTTKYNVFTYLPKSFLIQFARLPNVYFLASAIIQSIPIISPLTSVTAIVPLVFVLSVSMIREWIEDLGRHKYDKINNEEGVIVLRNNQFIESESQTLNVGEIIVIRDNTQVPCDTIIWDSNWEEGICYVETSSWDGEKALKEKLANRNTLKRFHNSNNPTYPKCISISGTVQCDFPNPDLHQLDGKVNLKISNADVSFPIASKQLLWKGSIIKHTNWVVGIVWYTGLNNKIILNSKRPRMKLSQIENRMSKFLIGIFVFQMLWCAIGAYWHDTYYNKQEEFYNNFLIIGRDSRIESFITFFTYFLWLNTLIPISLIVTLEIVKIAQGFFIQWDVQLYSHYQKKFCKPYSVSLNEELGNVNYIFSDKTGTLTCNKMEFRYCVIGDNCYEYHRKDIERNQSDKQGNNDDNLNKNQPQSNRHKFNIINGGIETPSSKGVVQHEKVNPKVQLFHKFTINNIHSNNGNNWNEVCESKINSPGQDARSVYPILNSSNTNINNNINNNENWNWNKDKHNIYQIENQYKTKNMPEKKLKIIPIGNNYFENYLQNAKQNRENQCNRLSSPMNEEEETINHFWTALACAHECVCSEDNNNTLEYSGVSPDDVELVKAASIQGYTFLKSPTNLRRVMIGNQEKTFKIWNILNFSSERKRMSIILRDDNNTIRLYTKGADCEIKKRWSPNSKASFFTSISLSVDKFSSKGFRTLMIATKEISENNYKEWNNKLRSGEMNLSKKHQLWEECFNEMESNLYWLGATMVEDKLQDEVPETIKDLRWAGIKIWVLTGDKIDTAENIALSCNLISKEHKNFKVCATNGANWKTRTNFYPEWEQFISDFQEFVSKEEDNYWLNSSSNKSHSNGNSYMTSYTETPFSIWIEAPILANIFKDEETTKEFLKIALCASTVICCRVSPLQKSQVVRIVKEADKKAVTWAIGDGGNDVSMIMEAHIGIGLYGEEGMRAVQASDFAIGEFKILRTLLLFHGRTNSNRISKMILYFFYKNFVFTMTHFYFMFMCLSSGQTIIDDWFITCYNLIFTALPLGIQACSDFDLLESDGVWVKQMNPFWYKESRDNPLFSFKYFFLWNLKGLFFGLFGFLAWIFSSSNNIIDKNGTSENLWYQSVTLFTNIIFSVSITWLISVKYLIVLVPLVMFVTSWWIYFCFCFFVHYMSMFNSFASILGSFSSIQFWLNILLILTLSFVIDYSAESWRFFYGTSMATKLMLLMNSGKLDEETKYPEIIQKAKTHIDLISKYNNYNMWKETNIYSDKKSKLFTSQLDQNVLKYWNNRSKSLRTFKQVNLNITEKSFNCEFSKKIHSDNYWRTENKGKRMFNTYCDHQRNSLNEDELKNTINSNTNKIQILNKNENNQNEDNHINNNINNTNNNCKLVLRNVEGNAYDDYN